MIVNIDSTQFTIRNVTSLKQSENLGVYTLHGIDDELLHYARESVLNKTSFNIQISKQNKTVLVGEDCLFNHLDITSRVVKLTVNWIENSLV